MKIALISLGCSKNLVDSEIMLGFLDKCGFQLTENPALADIVIVNTCAFIKEAKEEAIDTICGFLELKKQGKIKKVIVAGCLAQRYQKELPDLLHDVDGFINPGSIDRVEAVVKAALREQRVFAKAKEKHYFYKDYTPRIPLTPKHFSYVKIADGCNNCCSYCVIPSIRGAYQSRPIESIIKEISHLVQSGVKEVNLISQDSSFYGRDIYKKNSLGILLKEITKIESLRWIRILYMHPKHLDIRLMEVIAHEPKICKYIDLPIQHINDKILELMRRKVTEAKIRKLIYAIRENIPNVVLRTSLIVGFPQETDEIFEQLYNFIKEIEFDRLGVFKYSAEENTQAWRIKGHVPENIKKKRLNKIMLLQRKITAKKNKQLIGREFDVLMEEVKGNNGIGRTQFDAPEVDGVVYVKGGNMRAGDMARVLIEESVFYDLIGEKI
ncbi:MAG: 30S ribosomal protein S12 methylthiotransferase RimO [Candidatus Omnitrophica bacterium]|nr:30S ribosomal protein S12 methylthiotransferase RimO [Candidatus Omnitrophota bacterium]